jgi:hypothetical protein
MGDDRRSRKDRGQWQSEGVKGSWGNGAYRPGGPEHALLPRLLPNKAGRAGTYTDVMRPETDLCRWSEA